MILPETFHFLRPAWLAAFVPLIAVLWLLARRRLRSRGWEAVCDPALLPHVLIGRSGPARRLPLILAVLAGVLAILALAGPVWRQLPQPLYTGGGALVIALDLSRSMDATDLPPSRLVRARFKVADVLAARREGQTALVVFAGEPFTVTPLTDDVDTIRSQLTALSTDIMPAAGSRGDKALLLAGDLLRQAGMTHGRILLVTDEAGARGADAARSLNAAGYRVSVLGAGTTSGAPVPLPDGGFLKTDGGEIVIPRLDEEALRSVAVAGGGTYVTLTVDDADLQTLTPAVADDADHEATSRSEFRADLWREEGPWLVLLLLPLAALAFRRGYLFVLPLLLVLPPRPAAAMSWDDLWLRPDQQGQRALEAGDAARAAELFRDPARLGAARYRAGDFEGAADALQQAPDVEALYNRGNALARAGRLDEAIAAYAEVLKRNPAHEDARYNKELVEKQKQPPPEQPQGGQGDQERQDPGQSQDQKQDAGQGDAGQRAEDSSDQGGAGDEQSRDGGQPEPQADRGDAGGPDGKGGAEEQMTPEQKPGKNAPDSGEEKRAPAQESEAAAAREGKGGEGDRQAAAAGSSDEVESPDEEDLAAEQWLRRIPDDPGGLLRRKFRYQYQQRAEAPDRKEQPW